MLRLGFEPGATGWQTAQTDPFKLVYLITKHKHLLLKHSLT